MDWMIPSFRYASPWNHSFGQLILASNLLFHAIFEKSTFLWFSFSRIRTSVSFHAQTLLVPQSCPLSTVLVSYWTEFTDFRCCVSCRLRWLVVTRPSAFFTRDLRFAIVSLHTAYHTLYHSAQLSYFIVVSQSPLVCWWHPAVHIIPTRPVQRKHLSVTNCS